MKKKVLLSYQDVLNFKFNPSKNGYNPLEVDTFLDDVLDTIDSKDKKINDLEKQVELLSEKTKELANENKKLEKDFYLFKEKYKNIKDSDFVENANTLEMIKKINLYERKLFELGQDPKKLNNSQSEWLLAIARGKSMLAHCWDACSVCARRKNNSRY